MTNADKIRQMSDEQLARFLWIWKINSVTTFLTQGGMNSMDAKDMREWVGQTTETFVCTETFVGDDYIFDQDFNDKADRKTEPQTIRCPKCGRTDYIRDVEKDMGIKGSHYKYKCINCNTYIKDEPTISKMEQVEDEPQTETTTNSEKVQLKVQLTDEPQTDCAWR